MKSKKDKLKIMFEYQRSLQVKLGTLKKIKNKKDLQCFINQNILAIIEEATEIMRCTPYKNPRYVKFGWKLNQQWNEKAFKEEIIDLFHFLMNLCIVINFNSSEFFKIYCKKNKINFNRKKGGY